MKKGKIEKGITFIALIITIVVLLILAVVTIREVQEDGIIAKAKEASELYEQKQYEENQILKDIEIVIKNIDKTVPTITVKPEPDSITDENQHYSKISFTIYDEGMDIDKVFINNDTIDKSEQTKEIDLNYNDIKAYLKNGENQIYVMDKVGNVSETITFIFTKEFEEYNSIEINSGQFIINTGSLSYKNKIELKIKILGNTMYKNVLLINNNNNKIALRIRIESDGMRIRRNSYEQPFIINDEFINREMTITQTDVKSIYQYEGKTEKVSINWERWINNPESRFDATDGTIYLGNVNCKIYYLKIFDIDGNIKDELIPVKKIEDGNSYLYDKITNKYYSCNGAVAKND